jgi:acyl carrier protein
MPEENFANLEQEIKQLISDITGRSLEELKPDANFWKDLGVDSIKAIEITVAIERKYKVRVRDEQIPQITTVGQAIKIVSEALRKKQDGS